MLGQCKNCGADLQGRYCSSCGKDSLAQTNPAKEFWSYLYAAFLSWDSQLFRTIRSLFADPRAVISAWAGGTGSSYLHPLRFVVIMAGLNLLAAHFTGASIIDSTPDSETARLMSEWIEKKFGLVWIMLIPFMAMGPYLIQRRIYPGYIMHLATVAYLTGVNNLINVPLHLLEIVLPSLETARDVLGFGLPFIYGCWFFRRVFNSAWSLAAGTMLLTYAFGVFGFLLLFVVVFLILDIFIS